MTTQEIRKRIKVRGYYKSQLTIVIDYELSPFKISPYLFTSLILNQDEAIKELIRMGEIESEDQWEKYDLSQWDALNLVIRHEYRKSLESDANMLEIDKALEALKNI